LYELRLAASCSLTKMAKKDYYQILGVKKDAKADEIKKSYRKLARKISPGRESERQSRRGEI
jgi:DnaJ-class molecular chaperone